MSKTSEFSTMIFCVVSAVLLGSNSLRISVGIALVLSVFGIWINEICKAVKNSEN